MTTEFPQNFSTLAIHGNFRRDPSGAGKTPIYQTSAYDLGYDLDATGDLFAGRASGNSYTRSGNPTSDALEERMALMDGGSAAVAIGSGQAAVFVALEPLLQPGDHVLFAPNAFGGSHSLLVGKLKKLGFHVDHFDPTDVTTLENNYHEKTKVIFVESNSNPDNTIPDFDGITAFAKEKHVVFAVDNTSPTAYLIQPLKHGADIVVYSTTKFINGHGNAIGGMIVDGGTFDWSRDNRYPALSAKRPIIDGSREPDLSLVDTFQDTAYAFAVRQAMTVFGPSPSPFNSFLTLNGLETLPLRMQQHTKNAQSVAEYLENHDDIAWVKYAGLPHDPNYERAQKYMPRGAGAIMAVKLKGGVEAAQSFIRNTRIFSHMANIGETKSLVIHPDNTTHRQLTAEQKKQIGIEPGVLRFSVGIEDTADILHDLEQSLAAFHASRPNEISHDNRPHHPSSVPVA